MHALLIVDLQIEFNPPPELVARIEAEAAKFPRRIFTRFINPPDSLFRLKLNRHSGTPGTPQNALVLSPQPDDLVLDKKGYGLHSEQIALIRQAGVTEVTVAGMDTDACVLGAMFSLWDHGIDCHVAPQLCASSANLHEPALRIAFQQFGH